MELSAIDVVVIWSNCLCCSCGKKFKENKFDLNIFLVVEASFVFDLDINFVFKIETVGKSSLLGLKIVVVVVSIYQPLAAPVAVTQSPSSPFRTVPHNTPPNLPNHTPSLSVLCTLIGRDST